MPNWEISENKPVQRVEKCATLNLDGGTSIYVRYETNWKSVSIACMSPEDRWEHASFEEMVERAVPHVLKAFRQAVADLERIVDGEAKSERKAEKT